VRQAGLLRSGLPEAMPGSVPAEAVLPAEAMLPAEAGVLRPRSGVQPVPAEAVLLLRWLPADELLPEAELLLVPADELLPEAVRPGVQPVPDPVLPEAGLLPGAADLQLVLHERLLDARLLPAQVQGEAVRPVRLR
jgi:hypothetical protein